MNTTHLVLVALGDTDDHVVDDRLDGADGSNLLSLTVDDEDLDGTVVDLLEGDVDVREVVLQGTAGTSDSDLSGLDLDGDVLRDVQDLLVLDETH